MGGGERGEGTGETELEEKERSKESRGREAGGGKAVTRKITTRETFFLKKPVSCPQSGKEIPDNSKENWHHMAPRGAHGGEGGRAVTE